MSSTGFRVVLRLLGMVAFLYVAFAAVFGEDTLINPFLGTFYVLLWVGLVPASLLLGPVFKAVSPVRTISQAGSSRKAKPPIVAVVGRVQPLKDQELGVRALGALNALRGWAPVLVIAGEFNSGKSSFINALLGEQVLPEGVTPTTDRVNILRHGPAGGEQLRQAALE